jgi:hypothetical protein
MAGWVNGRTECEVSFITAGPRLLNTFVVLSKCFMQKLLKSKKQVIF